MMKIMAAESLQTFVDCIVSNDRFKSFLFICNQYVSLNGCDFGHAAINCGIPQGSVLGCLFYFLLYIRSVFKHYLIFVYRWSKINLKLIFGTQSFKPKNKKVINCLDCMERGLFILFLENKMCVWHTINKIMVPIFQIIHTRNKILNPCASGGLE